MSEFLLAAALYVAFIAILLAVLRKMNGTDTPAHKAIDSVRQLLDPDRRFDELRTHTTNKVKAGTAWGKEL